MGESEAEARILANAAEDAGKAQAAENAVKGADAETAAKKYSEGKQALVDMAKKDKRTGMTEGDMQSTRSSFSISAMIYGNWLRPGFCILQ